MSEPWRNRIVGHGEEDGEQLLANPKNWRVHPKAQQDSLSGVLDDIGWIQSVVVNRQTGFVIDGHLRVALAISKGEKVPVVYVDLSPEEEALALATLDPLSAMAVADKEQLDALLREVSTGNAAVQAMLADLAKDSGLDYGKPKPEDPGAQMDRAEELRAKWGTERGQLWQVGRHRLMCGDSTSAEDVARLMGREKAQLVYTDPPYGVDYDGGTKVREKLAGDSTTMLYEPACEMARLFSDDKAALYLWHAGVKGIAAAAAAAAAGYDIRCELVWNKNQAQFGALSAQYKQKHEPCYYCFRRGRVPRWFGPTNEVTVWDCNRATVNDFHPTQKPPELAARAMQNSSESGDIVLDLFVGSGTTLVAAEQLGRICYGMEIEPKYVAVALERMVGMGLEPKLLTQSEIEVT